MRGFATKATFAVRELGVDPCGYSLRRSSCASAGGRPRSFRRGAGLLEDGDEAPSSASRSATSAPRGGASDHAKARSRVAKRFFCSGIGPSMTFAIRTPQSQFRECAVDQQHPDHDARRELARRCRRACPPAPERRRNFSPGWLGHGARLADPRTAQAPTIPPKDRPMIGIGSSPVKKIAPTTPSANAPTIRVAVRRRTWRGWRPRRLRHAFRDTPIARAHAEQRPANWIRRHARERIVRAAALPPSLDHQPQARETDRDQPRHARATERESSPFHVGRPFHASARLAFVGALP